MKPALLGFQEKGLPSSNPKIIVFLRSEVNGVLIKCVSCNLEDADFHKTLIDSLIKIV